jgi:tetratricopeptide (TPR) repeat protein
LGNYDKVYYFKNYQDVVSLINKHKQDYFYTIEETIYFNELWNHIFLVPNKTPAKSYFKNIQNKNIVFITSKIIVSDNKFSYVKKRSYYTKQERFQQTIRTIESIRNAIPDAYIVLLDNSIFNNLEYKLLDELTDTFINITDNYTLNFFTDIFEYKAFGEISQQLAFLNLFLKEDYLSIKNFFKITGRYELNSDFNYHQYDNNLNIFKKDTNIDSKNYYFTCFYKLDKSILKQVQTIFETFIQNKEKYMNNYSDLEVIFPNAIIDKITLVDNLGVQENIGVWKRIRNI